MRSNTLIKREHTFLFSVLPDLAGPLSRMPDGMPGHSQSACSESPESESEPSDVESTPGSASASAKAALVQAAAVARAISSAISEG